MVKKKLDIRYTASTVECFYRNKRIEPAMFVMTALDATPPKIWRECIKKVWGVDPLECPKCHAEMKIMIFITLSQPEVIRQILEHLGLWGQSRSPPKELQPVQDVIQEPFDDGWPGYEESVHTVN